MHDLHRSAAHGGQRTAPAATLETTRDRLLFSFFPFRTMMNHAGEMRKKSQVPSWDAFGLFGFTRGCKGGGRMTRNAGNKRVIKSEMVGNRVSETFINRGVTGAHTCQQTLIAQTYEKCAVNLICLTVPRHTARPLALDLGTLGIPSCQLIFHD